MGDAPFVCEVSSPSETAWELWTRLQPQLREVMVSAKYKPAGGDTWKRTIWPGYFIFVLAVFGLAIFLWGPLILILLGIPLLIVVIKRPMLKATVTYRDEDGEAILRVSGRDDRLRASLVEIGIDDVTPQAA